ncbi:hypothetical protein F5887DRAFT_1279875 [Amanita rubescens]|nr:hypothetical protein F5887DRAFT_1279875 [Amanita rubescens]
MSSVWCLVTDSMKHFLGETAVPISLQTSILELKQLLKEMEPIIFGDVHIHMLEVWRCTALNVVDEDLKERQERLCRIDFSNNQTAARILHNRLNVSSLGMQENEMLLVRLPSPLWCLIVDLDQKPVSNIISVTIFPGTDVLNVMEMVLAISGIEIGVTELSVWRCLGLKLQGKEEDGQAFKARVHIFDLSNNQHAARLFEASNVLELEVPPDEILLVQLPHIRKDKRKHDENDDPPSEVKRLRMKIADAPSVLANASQFKKIAGPDHVIAFNRPFEPFTIPLVLLHEAFAIFKDRCEKAPSARALVCLSELVPVACKWHDHELTRRTEIQSILEQHMGLRFCEQKVPGTEFVTGGNLAFIVIPAALRECKNEHGDALNNQALLYYANFLSKALNHPRRFYNFNTCFPSILMIDMGSYLGFYGAVWDGKRVRVEPLTPLLDLSTHWREAKARCAMAAAFDALPAAVDSIEAHYNSIEAEARVNPTPPQVYDPDLQKARGYPFLTSYGDNGQEINFMYNERLHDEKLVFCAAIVNQPDSDEFLIKFTSRGRVRISADWIAVIMDKSKHRVLYGLNLSDADKEKVRHKVTSMMRTLHQAGFVHGDIRESNILIDVESLTSDDVMIHLIDFDWAGPIGEAKYPADVNKITVRRPDGVKGGGPITEQHDIDMISFLLT